MRFYLGYSGWAAGQLDFELERDSWHVVAADTDSIFSAKTDSLWDLLIDRLEPDGIQVDNRPSLPMLAYGNNPCCQYSYADIPKRCCLGDRLARNTGK